MSLTRDAGDPTPPFLGAPIAAATKPAGNGNTEPAPAVIPARPSGTISTNPDHEIRPAAELDRTPPKTSYGEPVVIRGMMLATESDLAHLENPYEGGYSHSTGVPSAEAVAAAKAHEEEIRKERELEQRRLISGFDNDDLNALLRAFDKVRRAALSRLTPSLYTTLTLLFRHTTVIYRLVSICNLSKTRSSRWTSCAVR